jgi:hypothetical protein
MINKGKNCPKGSRMAENEDIFEKKLIFSCTFGNNYLLLSPIYIN